MAEEREKLTARWGRAADYLFGRNMLIGIASFMLLIISGYATWHGMRDFIVVLHHDDAREWRHIGFKRRAGDRGRRRADVLIKFMQPTDDR